MRLTGRAALAALAGGLVVLVAGTGLAFIVVNVVLLLAIATDLVLATPVSAVAVARSGDTKIHLGQSGTVTLTVTNNGHRRLRGMVRDGWRPSAAAQPSRSAVSLPAGERASVTTTLTPQRRGDYTGGAITIASLGPFRLAARQRDLQAPWTVRVLPPFLSRKHLPEKLARLRALDGQHRSMIRGQGTEFDSLREYVLGDDVRSIDWRSSARHADVLVRTWRPERDRRIVIVLDTGRTSAVRAGDKVDLIAVDRRVRARVVNAGRGDVLAAITSELALLEPDLIEPDTGLMAAAVLGVARQRCLVVLLTDLNPAAIEQGLLPRIQPLSSRHQVLLAAVTDPRIAQMARGRGDLTGVYDAAAAVSAVAAREHAGALLRRSGVEIVDAPPDLLPPALADAYLS
jgi:uncharacterized protein (DUF58 family)